MVLWPVVVLSTVVWFICSHRTLRFLPVLCLKRCLWRSVRLWIRLWKWVLLVSVSTTRVVHVSRKVSTLWQVMLKSSSAISWHQVLSRRFRVSSVLVPVVLFILRLWPTSHWWWKALLICSSPDRKWWRPLQVKTLARKTSVAQAFTPLNRVWLISPPKQKKKVSNWFANCWAIFLKTTLKKLLM